MAGRWPAPCLEDWLGAGAILSHLEGRATPEVLTARAAFESLKGNLETAVLHCPSGEELGERGYASDVRIATELDVSDCVPVFSGQSYWRAGTS